MNKGVMTLNTTFCLKCYISLNSCKQSPVFNLQSLDDLIHVELPKDKMHYKTVYMVEELVPQRRVLTESVDYSINHLWVDLQSDKISKQIGLHKYAIKVVDTKTNDTSTFFTQFVLQDDFPERPYIYMNRDNSTNEETN